MAFLKLNKENAIPPANGYDGDWEQGLEYPRYRIWELNDYPASPRFFKQTGTMDSYGETTWDSDDMPEVFATPRVITVFDFEG